MKHLKSYKIFEANSIQPEDLTINLVKDIILSLYEEEFDSHKFEFFERKKEGYEIDFIPEDTVIYFNISMVYDLIRISVLCKKMTRFDILTNHSEEKINELSSILSEYGYHLSKPAEHKPHDACFVLHPNNDNANLVYTTLRESKYSIIPNI